MPEELCKHCHHKMSSHGKDVGRAGCEDCCNGRCEHIELSPSPQPAPETPPFKPTELADFIPKLLDADKERRKRSLETPTVEPYTEEEIKLMHVFGHVLNEDKNEPPYELSEWTEMARFLATIAERDAELASYRSILDDRMNEVKKLTKERDDYQEALLEITDNEYVNAYCKNLALRVLAKYHGGAGGTPPSV